MVVLLADGPEKIDVVWSSASVLSVTATIFIILSRYWSCCGSDNPEWRLSTAALHFPMFQACVAWAGTG